MKQIVETENLSLCESITAAYDSLVGLASAGETLDVVLASASAIVGQGVAFMNPEGDVVSAQDTSANFREKVGFLPLQELRRFFTVIDIDDEDGPHGHLILETGTSEVMHLLPPVRLAVQVHVNALRSKSKKRQRYAEDFLERLPDAVEREKLEEDFKAMHVDFSAGVQVVVGTADDETFLKRLDSRLRNYSRNGIASVRRNRFISVLSPPASSDLASLTKNLVEICLHVARRHYDDNVPPDVCIAFGGSRQDPLDLEESAREAFWAFRVATSRGDGELISLWEELGAFRLISRISACEEALSFCKTTLKGIAYSEYGEHDELLETIVQLEKNNWNLREVARKMFYHHNTIKRRYAKIQEILGENLSDPDVRFEVSLAIRLLRCLPPRTS